MSRVARRGLSSGARWWSRAGSPWVHSDELESMVPPLAPAQCIRSLRAVDGHHEISCSIPFREYIVRPSSRFDIRRIGRDRSWQGVGDVGATETTKITEQDQNGNTETRRVFKEKIPCLRASVRKACPGPSVISPI